MKPTKKKFEEYLNKKSITMNVSSITKPLTKVNIRSDIRGNFGNLLRRHNPTEFNKMYKKHKSLYFRRDAYHSNIKLHPEIIKTLDEYEKLRAKGLTHREAADKLEKKM